MTSAAGPPRHAIALSGGGYRATLLAVGALLAIVDRGLNASTTVISSVSGGSITNAVVAAQTDFRALRPGDLDEIARKVADATTSRKVSVLPAGLTAFVAIAPPAYLTWLALAAWTSWHPAARSAVAALASLSYLMLTVGRVLAVQLGHVFSLRAPLGDLTGRTTVHEFCAVDLVTGLPLTFSTEGAAVHRQYEDRHGGRAVVTTTKPSWNLDNTVRASAAFPGVPPKLVRFSFDPDGRVGRLALCADGGIWNNLATHTLDVPGRRGGPVLCVNASVHPTRARPWPYFVPGVGTIAALVRTMTILNRNTVEPRLEAINRRVVSWAAARGRSDEPPDIVVADMRPIDHAQCNIRALGIDVGLDLLVAQPWWQALVAGDDRLDVRTPTKLDRVGRADAHTLICRGYANTWLASLLIHPLDEHGVLPGEGVVDRLAAISGARPPSRPGSS